VTGAAVVGVNTGGITIAKLLEVRPVVDGVLLTYVFDCKNNVD
jgi:hypothetical protein